MLGLTKFPYYCFAKELDFLAFKLHCSFRSVDELVKRFRHPQSPMVEALLGDRKSPHLVRLLGCAAVSMAGRIKEEEEEGSRIRLVEMNTCILPADSATACCVSTLTTLKVGNVNRQLGESIRENSPGLRAIFISPSPSASIRELVASFRALAPHRLAVLDLSTGGINPGAEEETIEGLVSVLGVICNMQPGLRDLRLQYVAEAFGRLSRLDHLRSLKKLVLDTASGEDEEIPGEHSERLGEWLSQRRELEELRVDGFRGIARSLSILFESSVRLRSLRLVCPNADDQLFRSIGLQTGLQELYIDLGRNIGQAYLDVVPAASLVSSIRCLTELRSLSVIGISLADDCIDAITATSKHLRKLWCEIRTVAEADTGERVLNSIARLHDLRELRLVKNSRFSTQAIAAFYKTHARLSVEASPESFDSGEQWDDFHRTRGLSVVLTVPSLDSSDGAYVEALGYLENSGLRINLAGEHVFNVWRTPLAP